VTPLGAATIMCGVVPDIDFIGADGTIWQLMGGRSTFPSVQDGMVLLQIGGLNPSFDLLDEQGARQDGITNLDTVFNACYIGMKLEASSATQQSFRRVVRMWLSSWQPPNVGTLNVTTRELGQWWMPVRQAKPIEDDLIAEPALHQRMEFTWACRGDNAFWQGIDSTSVFPGGVYPGAAQSLTSGAATGFCPLTNLGTRPGWPRYLVYGPGTFTLGNGALPTAQGTISNAGSPITFGPLEAGQIALITTLPRLRSVIDLSPNQPAQKLTAFQTWLENAVNLVANSNTAPLLESLESVFGILPPVGVMYSLLNGRFTNLSEIPGKADGYPPVTTYIPVSITGGGATGLPSPAPQQSTIVAALTPYRTWPW
jgi:hypothetical protein